MPDQPVPLSGVSQPMVGEAGQTGTWRTLRPIIDQSRCLACEKNPGGCQLCWLYCPEACMNQGMPPTIDYRYCKGCGCCAKECPANAIDMLPEESE